MENKMRAKPPVTSEVKSEEKKRDFIAGSEKKQEIESNFIPHSEGDYPWNDEKLGLMLQEHSMLGLANLIIC